MTVKFEFDANKSAVNLAKHGIDFEQAQALWIDPEKAVRFVQHPAEDRWMVIGQIDGKLWSAVITYRELAVRIISVRRARRNEAKDYGRATPSDG